MYFHFVKQYMLSSFFLLTLCAKKLSFRYNLLSDTEMRNPPHAIATGGGYAPGRLWLQRKPKDQVCFL